VIGTDLTTIPATKLLKGFGIVGELLEKGDQRVGTLRKALLEAGLNNNEIAMVFNYLQHGRVRGVEVKATMSGDGSGYVWSLKNVVVRP
jgi:hypothetical protein